MEKTVKIDKSISWSRSFETQYTKDNRVFYTNNKHSKREMRKIPFIIVSKQTLRTSVTTLLIIITNDNIFLISSDPVPNNMLSSQYILCNISTLAT